MVRGAEAAKAAEVVKGAEAAPVKAAEAVKEAAPVKEAEAAKGAASAREAVPAKAAEAVRGAALAKEAEAARGTTPSRKPAHPGTRNRWTKRKRIPSRIDSPSSHGGGKRFPVCKKVPLRAENGGTVPSAEIAPRRRRGYEGATAKS